MRDGKCGRIMSSIASDPSSRSRSGSQRFPGSACNSGHFWLADLVAASLQICAFALGALCGSPLAFLRLHTDSAATPDFANVTCHFLLYNADTSMSYHQMSSFLSPHSELHSPTNTQSSHNQNGLMPRLCQQPYPFRTTLRLACFRWMAGLPCT